MCKVDKGVFSGMDFSIIQGIIRGSFGNNQKTVTNKLRNKKINPNPYIKAATVALCNGDERFLRVVVGEKDCSYCGCHKSSYHDYRGISETPVYVCAVCNSLSVTL